MWEPGTHIWDVEPCGPENSDCREAGKGVQTRALVLQEDVFSYCVSVTYVLF